MSDRPSIARAVTDLVADMPTRFDPVEARAAWIRRKAAVMRRIAAETTDPSIARQATAEADRADRQAATLDTADLDTATLDTGSETGS
jgi:hypothetical protein